MRAGLAALTVSAVLVGGALGAPGASRAQGASGLDGFGGTTAVVTPARAVQPLYREQATRTNYTLRQVPCASWALGDRSTRCFIAAS